MTSSSGSSFNDSLFQNSFYVGNNLENILYGVQLVLYLKTIRILLSRKKGTRRKSDVFYALFSSVMVFCVTVWVATSAIFGEEMWLLQATYPGGPGAFWENNISIWYMDWATTSIIVLQLMTDALMIYRCRIIWNSYYAVIIPIILWISALVLGILVDWASSVPGGDFFSGLASVLGLSYYAVSVFLNTTLTCMICYRMLRHGKIVKEGLGREYASSYFIVVAIVVESMIPYTLSGIAFLVSLGIGSSTSVAFVSVYFLMMCISPQMLILRAMLGTAWNKDTYVLPGSTLHFSPVSTGALQWSASSEQRTQVHLQSLPTVYVPDGRENKALISELKSEAEHV